MDIKKVYAIYLSPTGTTERAVLAMAEGTGLPYEKIDLTTLKSRQNLNLSFGKNELVITGMPVYGGRIPMNLENFFSGLKGNDTPTIALVMYGNREYEDALLELKIKMEEWGFKVIAGAAFIGEHTFSKKIATGRPDAGDLKIAREFGGKVIKEINKAIAGKLAVKGNYPSVKKGFDPTNPNPLIEHTKIITTEDCTSCGICAENCPWGAIEYDDFSTESKKCLRCFRCIKICPEGARKLDDPEFYEWIKDFEKRLTAVRKEPELFLTK
jgi:ferredoxin/flavodoxin